MSGSLHRIRERLSPLGNMHARGEAGAVDRAAALVRRPADRMFLARAQQLSALRALGASVETSAPPESGVAALVLGLRYMPDHLAYESVIAQALRMRGVEVAMLNCGGGMPICEVGWGREAWPRPCDRCGFHTDRVLAASAVEQVSLADSLPWGGDPTDAPSGAVEDAAARAVASISIPWFLRAADPASVPESGAATEDFQVAVQGVAAAAERILDETKPHFVFMLNGLFAAERAIRAAALARGIRVVTYEIAPRAGHLVFSQDAPAPEYDTGAAWARVRELPLTDEQSAALDEQLHGRVAGKTSHERYFDAPREDLASLKIPSGHRVISLFTNLAWDSACIDHDIAYPSMIDWMAGAVRAMEGVDDATLVIRVHPAEERWGTRERAEDGLRARVGDWPRNVRFVGPSDPLSTYTLAEASDLVLTYTTTVGLEAAVRGIQVAVAGETHYRGRGFTHDLSSHDDLVAAVRSVRGPLPPEQVELARRYAFTFFFRAMLPFPPVAVEAGHVKACPSSAAEVAPGADPYLDWICDRILDGEEFTLPDELALARPPAPASA
jgi:hypothetical protein